MEDSAVFGTGNNRDTSGNLDNLNKAVMTFSGHPLPPAALGPLAVSRDRHIRASENLRHANVTDSRSLLTGHGALPDLVVAHGHLFPKQIADFGLNY